MEVMPVYQTSLFLYEIIVGMVCLDELRFYTNSTLGCILFATLCCCLGIKILLLKYEEKVASINIGNQGEKTPKDDANKHNTSTGYLTDNSDLKISVENISDVDKITKHDSGITETYDDKDYKER